MTNEARARLQAEVENAERARAAQVADMGEDDRLKTDPAVADRAAREALDRTVSENRTLTEDDRLEMFRQSLFNDALPDLPKLPGYHVCWLTTTNHQDPIHRRLRLGYELITKEMVPGFEYASLKTGEYAGIIGVNEMVAARLPMSLYEKFMQEVHHNAPNREDEKLTATVDALHEQAERAKARLIEEEGTKELRRQKAVGKFDLSA